MSDELWLVLAVVVINVLLLVVATHAPDAAPSDER